MITSSRNPRQKLVTSMIGLSTAVLLLTGCSSGSADVSENTTPGGNSTPESSPTQSQTVYQFDEARVVDPDDQVPFTTNGDEFIIKLSDDLAAAMPENARQTIDHYTVSAKAFDTGVCRMDVDVEYVHNGQEALEKSRPHSGDTPHARTINAFTAGTRAYNETTVVNAIPSDDEIDIGQYMTKDFSHVTFVDKCSEGQDDDRIIKLTFPTYEDLADDFVDFAVAEVSVVRGGQSGQGGTTVIISGETEARVGPTGKWKRAGE